MRRGTVGCIFFCYWHSFTISNWWIIKNYIIQPLIITTWHWSLYLSLSVCILDPCRHFLSWSPNYSFCFSLSLSVCISFSPIYTYIDTMKFPIVSTSTFIMYIYIEQKKVRLIMYGTYTFIMYIYIISTSTFIMYIDMISFQCRVVWTSHILPACSELLLYVFQVPTILSLSVGPSYMQIVLFGLGEFNIWTHRLWWKLRCKW